MSHRILFAFALLVLASVPSFGAEAPVKLDAEPKSPYTWRIVLHTRPHPLLNPAFRNTVRRDVVAALQPLLGSIGSVEFVDLADVPKERWEPLWRQFDERGFTALDFDSTRELNGIHTHILHVDYRDGAYHTETRLLDGFTGLPSPISRKQFTRAAELVGRTAGQMLSRDFGIDGIVEPGERTGEATVRIRGGSLGPLDRFVKEGDVFAIAGLRKSARPQTPPTRSATGRVIEKKDDKPAGFTATLREFTLLRAVEAPKEGAIRCKVLSGYGNNPMPIDRGVLGYRAMKLPTMEAPLALRLVGERGSVQRNTATARARANDIGWAVPAGSDDLELRDGVFHSARPLGHVAFVTLSVGDSRTAKVPVAVLGAGPISIPFLVNPEDEKRVRFERDCFDLARRVSETRTAQASCFAALSKLITALRNTDALARARAGHAATAADDQELTDVLARLREQAGAYPAAISLLAACDRQLADVRKSQAELADRIKDLEAIVARENDPARVAEQVQAQATATRIKLLLERGEVDEAISAYDQLATQLPNDADVIARRDKLKAEWAPKSEDHAKAREFLYKTWPALATIPDLRDSMPALASAVGVCVSANDRYALRKLLASLADLPVKLNDLITPLDASNDTDRKLLIDAKSIRDGVERIDADVREFLKKD